jgi:hypothetical protein
VTGSQCAERAGVDRLVFPDQVRGMERAFEVSGKKLDDVIKPLISFSASSLPQRDAVPAQWCRDQ